MFVLSRKVMLAVRRGIDAIIDGTFTETTIKLLMIDLRELARNAPRIGADDPVLTPAFSSFVDVSDFIAHTNRDHRTRFESHIRVHAERLADMVNEKHLEGEPEFPGVAPLYSMDTLINGMLGTAYLLLSSFEKGLATDYILPANQRKTEIELCILSLLQDSFIRLNGNRGHAFLSVHTHEGYFRLYCQIHGSKLEADAQRRTGGSGRVTIGFPVLITSVRDTDGVLKSYSSDITLETELGAQATPSPPLIETYRDDESRLRVRVVMA